MAVNMPKKILFILLAQIQLEDNKMLPRAKRQKLKSQASMQKARNQARQKGIIKKNN